MFHDPTIVGSWPELAARLDEGAAFTRWAEAEPAFAGLTGVDDLLAGWAEPGRAGRTDAVLAALVRLAAVDGGRDEDALLLTLHLLSGLVWRMTRQLQHLCPDVTRVIVAELTCQIRRYPWRRRPRAVAANLRVDTRTAVLAELRPRRRRQPQPVEVLTVDGDVTALQDPCPVEDEDLDVVDLLEWAVRAGVDAGDVALLIATECARARRQRRADLLVAEAHGITPRTLYRRRERTLTALRDVAAEYLAAVA